MGIPSLGIRGVLYGAMAGAGTFSTDSRFALGCDCTFGRWARLSGVRGRWACSLNGLSCRVVFGDSLRAYCVIVSENYNIIEGYSEVTCEKCPRYGLATCMVFAVVLHTIAPGPFCEILEAQCFVLASTHTTD